MSRPLHSRAVLVETVQPDGGTEGGGVHPFASRFEMMAARSGAISPRLGQVLGVLLDAARPSHCGGRAVLRPLWAEEAMHRAYNMLVLVMQLHQVAGVRPEDDVALRVDLGVASDLAALFRTLEIRKEDEELPCSCVPAGRHSKPGCPFGIWCRTCRHPNRYRAPVIAGVQTPCAGAGRQRVGHQRPPPRLRRRTRWTDTGYPPGIWYRACLPHRRR